MRYAIAISMMLVVLGCGLGVPERTDDEPVLVPTRVDSTMSVPSPAAGPEPTEDVSWEAPPTDPEPAEDPEAIRVASEAAADVIRTRIAWKKTHAPDRREPTATPLPVFGRELVARGIAESSDLGLMWTTEAAGGFSPEDAAAYCEVLDVGGYDDWRLPPVDELLGVLYAEIDRSWGAEVRELWSATPHDPRGFETVGVPGITRSSRVVGIAHVVCTRSVAPVGGS